MGAFIEALSVLSKSSPQAVEIEHSQRDTNRFKEYLYISTPLEDDFEHLLNQRDIGKIIFVCGSSGDGKSAILTRYNNEERFSHIKFHLDATHALNPNDDAIETLDKLFSGFPDEYSTLVVGINIGMIANYVEKGKNNNIKSALNDFLLGNSNPSNCIFLSFEDKKYSKFNFEDGQATSKFAKDIIKLLTSDTNNPFRDALDIAKKKNEDSVEILNFNLLCLPEIQDAVVELLIKIRLSKDQFLTTRALLDFIFNILIGPKYIFDNLFTSESSDLLQQLKIFDPATVRNKHTDSFLLEKKLNLPCQEFLDFNEDVRLKYGLTDNISARAYIRLFYIFRKLSFSNNYHLLFNEDSQYELLPYYTSLKLGHEDSNGDQGKYAKLLQDFYRNVLSNAVSKYLNRNAPHIRSNKLLLATYNNVMIISDFKISPSWRIISSLQESVFSTFTCAFNLDKNINPITFTLNINLLDLLMRLNKGYRPNKHDKNSVILLEDIVLKIKAQLIKKTELTYMFKEQAYEVEQDGNYIEVIEK